MRLVMKLQRMRWRGVGRGRCRSLCFKPSVQTLSKAFETSLSVTVSIVFLLWAICEIVSWNVARAVCVPLNLRKPCWSGWFKSLLLRWEVRVVLMKRSRTLPGVSRRDIGL